MRLIFFCHDLCGWMQSHTQHHHYYILSYKLNFSLYHYSTTIVPFWYFAEYHFGTINIILIKILYKNK